VVTAQISDRVRLRDVEYALLGPRSGLFVPQAHGIHIAPMHTACWRGFRLLYTLTDRLRLAHVHLQMAHPDPDVALLGVRPVVYERGRAEFRDLAHPIDFTGRLWLASGLLGAYVRFGGAPFHFETVHEVVLDHGAVTAEHDRSAGMAELRAQIAAKKISKGQLQRWLAAHLG
jgi:hypothetical protein